MSIYNYENTADYHFTGFIENIKVLCSALKAIHFQESGMFRALDQGLRVTVEQNKCVQASAYIPRDNFWKYRIVDTSIVEFKVNLNVLTECLNIFGSEESSCVRIFYKEKGAPLILLLENKLKDATIPDEQITDCEIKTQEVDELMYFKDDDVVEKATIIMKGIQFMGVLNDLEKTTEVIEIKISPIQPNISIIATGPQDKSSIDIPKTSDMIHAVTCSEDISIKYKFAHIKLTVKALALASKVALKIDSRGLLIVQHMIDREEKDHMYIEFHITPLVDDDDDDDDEDDDNNQDDFEYNE